MTTECNTDYPDRDIRSAQPTAGCHVSDCHDDADWEIATQRGDKVAYDMRLCDRHRSARDRGAELSILDPYVVTAAWRQGKLSDDDPCVKTLRLKRG